MKRIVLVVLLFIGFNSAIAQDRFIDPVDIESIENKVNSFISFMTEEELDFLIDYSNHNSAMAEFWDNDSFNPYGYNPLKKPFKLTFADTVYTSPILINKVITSRYGWRNRRPHKGIDIDLVTGDTVRSLLDGKVRYVKYHSGHGKTVVVRHSNGLELVYAHLSEQLVKPNDLVRKGDIIGKGGVTGNARGSHLHLETIYKGNHINPEYIFDFGKNNNIRSSTIWVSDKWMTPYLHSSKRQSTIDIATSLEEANAVKANTLRTHIIRKGDSLYGIARKYGVTVAALCKANKIKSTKILKPGQRLIIGL
ncbi:MAG: peptidoglycan DD-metalloendopeptidase family protein [Flavobacteriaceae bacterium]|nr:peptidoglycan DD-metalloendopeptidase family protein [Flavobacteriaceae bacterium]